jgi:hypothetical protein
MKWAAAISKIGGRARSPVLQYLSSHLFQKVILAYAGTRVGLLHLK